jgi:hypothetical protein
MLVPQFSIRQMLAIVTALGVFSLVVSLAMRGHAWAMSLVITCVTLLVAFLLYGLCFFAAWCCWLIVGRWTGEPEPQSPFAQDAPPPQIIPPEEPPT